MSVGGVLRPKEPRTPRTALEGPSGATASMGQAILPGHFRVQVEDLRGPLTYVEQPRRRQVRGDRRGGGRALRRATVRQARFGEVAVKVTDADGLEVSETRKVYLVHSRPPGPGRRLRRPGRPRPGRRLRLQQPAAGALS